MKQLLAPLASLLVAASAALAAEPTTFSAKVSGHGQPMLLIPGLASSGSVWDGTVEHFKDRYTCHVISVAGFAGEPARKSETALLATVRDELATYIRERGLARPVVVGHSLGAFIALDLAAKHPELPGALVLVDGLPFFYGVMQPGGTSDDARRAADAMSATYRAIEPAAYDRMIRGGPNGSTMASAPEDLDRIVAWGLASDGATVAQAMTEMLTTDLRAELPKIQAPALALAAWVGYAPHSSHEFVDRTYRAQYEGLKGVRIEITDTARHFVMLDEPDWLHARIDAFLGTSPAATSTP